jgi:hypothetical protein
MVQYWPTQEDMAIHGFDNATYGLDSLPLYAQTTEYQPQQQFTMQQQLTPQQQFTPSDINQSS